MKRGKVVILGCGHWGRNYVRVMVGLLGVDRVLVADTETEVLKALARQYHGIRTASRLSEVLADETLSMAIIATPATTHYSLARQCLSAGLDVLAEKPLALKASEAERLAGHASKEGRVLMVGHTFLYNPAVRKIRDLMARGVCGDVYYMKATRTHLGLIRPDVNAVWDLAPHDVAIFDYLLGTTPLVVSALGGCYLQPNKEDVAFVTLRYPRDIIASIHVSWADANKERKVEVVGSRARIVFDDLNTMERVRVFKKGISANVAGATGFGEYLFALRDGDIVSPKIEASEPLVEVCNDFLRCVRTRREPLAGSRNGVHVVRTMCAIDRSLRHRGRPVNLVRYHT